MEKRGRSYTAIKESMSAREFDAFCTRIATQYAESEKFSSYYMKTEDMSKNCFFKILDEAVVRNLVTDEIVSKMEKRAYSNQKARGFVAGAMSFRSHYAMLREMRDGRQLSVEVS